MLKPSSSYKTLKARLAEINAGRDIGPGNVLVVYRTGDTVGQQIAEYYQSVRGIPADNMLSVPLAWVPADGNVMTEADANIVLAAILAKVTTQDIQTVVTCHWWPFYVGSSGACTVNTIFRRAPYLNSLTSGRYTSTPAGNVVDLSLYEDVYKYTNSFTHNATTEIPFGLKPGKNSYSVLGTEHTISRFCLEVSPVATGDNRIASASEYNYVKRIIDDAIAAENAANTNVGTVVITGGTYASTVGSYFESGGKGATVYHEGIRTLMLSEYPTDRLLNFAANLVGNYKISETGNVLLMILNTGTTASGAPVWGNYSAGEIIPDGTVNYRHMGLVPADTFQAGANTTMPNRIGKTYVALTDVMFRAVGVDSYHSYVTQPEQKSDLTYRQGAIVHFGQSYGYTPNPIAGLDYEFGAPTPNALTATACVASSVPIRYNNANGLTLSVFYFQGPATATVEVTGGSIILKEGATTKATIVPSGTLRQQYASIQASLTVGWTMIVQDSFYAGFAESRCGNAIKNGACVAFGSGIEPNSYVVKTTHLLQNLWDGMNLAEASYTKNISMGDSMLDIAVGDPLYRPFGHRR